MSFTNKGGIAIENFINCFFYLLNLKLITAIYKTLQNYSIAIPGLFVNPRLFLRLGDITY